MAPLIIFHAIKRTVTSGAIRRHPAPSGCPRFFSHHVQDTYGKKRASPIFRSQESEFLLKLRQSIPPLKGAFARFSNGRCNLAAENSPESGARISKISTQNHVLAALEILEHSPSAQYSLRKTAYRERSIYIYNYIVETATSHSKAKMKNYNSKKLVVFHLSQLDLK